MPCDTCGHTIQNVGVNDETRRVFWCPRCGSLTTEIKGAVGPTPADVDPAYFRTAFEARREHEPPKIVSRALSLLGICSRSPNGWPHLPEVRSLREAATGRAEP